MYKICEFLDCCSRDEKIRCGGILCGDDVYYYDIFSKFSLEGIIWDVLMGIEKYE